MKPAPAPEKLANVAIRMLKAAGKSRAANQARSYFKPNERIVLYGVSTPKLRQIERELFQGVRQNWTVDDAIQFCHVLLQDTHLEAKFIGILLLSRYKRSFGRTLLKRTMAWAARQGSNWATTDAISILLVAPLVRKHPDLLAALSDWASSRNLWVRRAAAVSLTPSARRGEYLDEAYAVATFLLHDQQDLVQKATGWLLREAGKKDPLRLEAFLRARGTEIPRTTVRYAIERFAPGKRKMILVKTKSKIDRLTNDRATESPIGNR